LFWCAFRAHLEIRFGRIWKFCAGFALGRRSNRGRCGFQRPARPPQSVEAGAPASQIFGEVVRPDVRRDSSIAFSRSLPYNNFDNNVSKLLDNVVSAFSKEGRLPGWAWTAEEKQWRQAAFGQERRRLAICATTPPTLRLRTSSHSQIECGALVCEGAVRDVVGMWSDAASDIVKLSDYAARSIG